MFSVAMAFKKLFHKKLIYLVVVLQIAAGIYLLAAALDNFQARNVVYRESTRTLSSRGIQIIARARGDAPIVDALAAEDFTALQNSYGNALDMQLIKALKFSYLAMIQDELKIIDLNVLFVSDDFLGMTPSSELTYIGTTARQSIELLGALNKKTMDGSALKNGEYFDTIGIAFGLNDNIFLLDDNRFNVQNVAAELSTVVLNDVLLLASVTNDESITLQNAIFLPLSAYCDYAHYLGVSHRGSVKAWLKFEVVENVVGSAELYQLLDQLNALGGEQFSYQIDSRYLQLRETTMQLLEQVIQQMAVALSQLFLVAISSAGILYLILQKRIKSIAVAIMVGSSKNGQVLELLCEVYSVVFSGVICGVLAYLLLNGAVATMAALTWCVVLLVGVVIGGLAASLSLIGIVRLTPIEILQRV